MDIKKFRQPFYQVLPTALGEVGVFFVSAKDEEKFLKQVGEALNSQSDEEFAYTLFPLICRPSSQFVEGKYKSPEPVFSSEQIKSLSKEELDEIANIFLNHNRHLYFKTDTITEKRADGGTLVRFEYNEIEHPILDGETKLAYLHRTFVLHIKESTKKLKETFDSMLRFSRETNARISEVFSQGAQLRNLIDSSAWAAQAMHHAPKFDAARVKADLPQMPEIELPESPFVAIGEKMDSLSSQMTELIGLSSSSSKYFMEMNETEIQIAGELEKSGELSVHLTKVNIGLGALVLIVAIASLAWSLYTSFTNSRVEARLLQENKVALEEIVKTLKSIDQKAGAAGAAQVQQAPTPTKKPAKK